MRAFLIALLLAAPSVAFGAGEQEWLVALDAPADAATLAELARVGLDVTYAANHVPLVVARGDAWAGARAETRPGVLAVDIAPPVRSANQVAVAAIQAVSSSTYPVSARSLGLDGNGTVIAIVDSGVDDTHPCLAGRFIAGYDALARTTTNPPDANGHGTHVACSALGASGVAPGARLVDVRILDADGVGRWSDIAAAFDWLMAHRDHDWGGVRGIQVASHSWGASVAVCDGTSAISRAVDTLAEAGIIQVVAAGNDGKRGGLSDPGCADKAITVGAFDDRGTVSRSDDRFPDTWAPVAFSNCGPRASDGDEDTFDEQKPEVVAPGVLITSARRGGGETTMTGTSMATPFVAGTIALLVQARPGLTWHQAEAALAGGTYAPCRGYGALDALAAATRLMDPLVAGLQATTARSLEPVTFTPSPGIVAATYDFGDGTTGAGVPGQHAYARPGTYAVTAQLRDVLGRTVEATIDVTILNRPPTAQPRVSSLLAGQTVTVSAHAADVDGTLTAWEWRLDDVPVATTADFLHAFPPGTHDLSLTVVDDAGGTTTTNTTWTFVELFVATVSRRDATVPISGPPDTRLSWQVSRDGTVLQAGRVRTDAEGQALVRVSPRLPAATPLTLTAGDAHVLFALPGKATLFAPTGWDVPRTTVLRIQVQDQDGGRPGGTVAWQLDGSGPQGVATLRNGQATIDLRTVPHGIHVLHLSYHGAAAVQATSTTQVIDFSPRNVTLTLDPPTLRRSTATMLVHVDAEGPVARHAVHARIDGPDGTTIVDGKTSSAGTARLSFRAQPGMSTITVWTDDVPARLLQAGQATITWAS